MRKNYDELIGKVNDIYIQTKLVKGYSKHNLLEERDIEKLDCLVNELRNIIIKID